MSAQALSTLDTGPPARKGSAPQGWLAQAGRLRELRFLAYQFLGGLQVPPFGGAF